MRLPGSHRVRSVHGLEYRQQRQLRFLLIGAVSGTSAALESLETSFHQDLNGDGVIGVPATMRATAPASAVGLTNLSESSSGIVTLKGTADASSHVQILDGTNVVGMVTSANDGTWSFTSPSAVSNTVHTYTAQELDSTEPRRCKLG